MHTSLQQTFRNVTCKISWIWFPLQEKISRETGEKGRRNSIFCTPEEKMRSLVLTEGNQSAIKIYLGNNPHWIKGEEVLFVCFLFFFNRLHYWGIRCGKWCDQKVCGGQKQRKTGKIKTTIRTIRISRGPKKDILIGTNVGMRGWGGSGVFFISKVPKLTISKLIKARIQLWSSHLAKRLRDL